ncbi:DUF456 domain-containing protein [Polaribacter sp.]|nr:DUF456 domain-containing protein [Polaribacter sp.]MDA9092412.1 DUF456 domain-containing protein [Polaribacter sp.]MDB4010323.1 DUF456 domain-containing protein [Polaribacter sp.]MDB4181698.1 DUF456 domain-containing protein [Polaribacter sp.]
MDIFLLLLGFLLVLLGVVGAFLPVLPGPLTSWFGLLTLHFTSVIPLNSTFLGITLAIAILIWILDYIIPAMGTKKFGGSKYGVYGTTIGLIMGLFVPIPLGILIGAFLGAFIGELFYDSKDKSRAIKASFGSFIGLLASAFIKFFVASIYCMLFIMKIWEYKSVLF